MWAAAAQAVRDRSDVRAEAARRLEAGAEVSNQRGDGERGTPDALVSAQRADALTRRMTMLIVRDLMSPTIHTIGFEQSIAEAAKRMRTHHVRHLPVLDGGRIVGVLSERDVRLVEMCSAGSIEVGDVMSPEPYVVHGGTSLAQVAAEMVDRKVGSAVVTDHGAIVGIFTTVDALRALVERARSGEHPASRASAEGGARHAGG